MSMNGVTFAREAVLNNLTDSLLETELTADMFAPERFAGNAARLLDCVSRFRHIGELIDDNPEYATNLGLDRGARSGLSSQLTAISPDAIRHDRDKAISRWSTLRAFDQTGLSQARKHCACKFRV